MKEKEIKEESSELKKELEAEFPEGEETETEKGGVLTWKERPNYTYSPETKAKADELKEIMAKEVQEGIAVNNPSRFIEYRSNK